MSGDVKMLCEIAAVSRSGYYRWLNKSNHYKDEDDVRMIKEIFEKGKKKLGWRPIQMKLLNDYGIVMNHKKIKRIMRENNLITRIRKKNPYKMIMKKTQEHRTFDNLLDRRFEQAIPGRVLCTDITYLYFGYGRRAYLSVIKDIATKEILSWQLSNNLTMKFVLDSIDALQRVSTVDSKTMIHSDQGFHYTNPEYIRRLRALRLTQSMSRKGNCIDNAPVESFFGHLKDDVDYKSARTFEELREMIESYMDYYNHKRYQWEIKKMAPVEFRNHLLRIV
jgi:putative transposase